MFGRLQGLRSADAHASAQRLLAQFDLEEAADKAIAQFSGGMRRRLDLAASLITRPPLIFLDGDLARSRFRLRVATGVWLSGVNMLGAANGWTDSGPGGFHAMTGQASTQAQPHPRLKAF
jgi:ABC-type sugar transport system ATPase subunit